MKTKITKINNRIVRNYIREISKELTCSKDIKKALLHEIELQALDLESSRPVLTIDDLYNEIGSPQEIAQGFESRTDIEKIKKIAAKYKITKYICLTSCLIVIIVATVAAVVIISSDDYSSNTHVNSNIEEVTS